ncbi:hypothetical protein Np050604_194 [Cyanophage S-RIM44]|uniref:Uncharacterized protein n=1 Tax=Cyanophage S-RIM44 TaxID=1278485 RepID=A0A127KNG1_9CAUD|nr:hypothetical protein W270710_194 [Cyanophage S-RIM44]AOO11908.1 hypothetical protein Np050604_194 [Cyanophage S-RIM44]AOO12609.1 hypothetical protein Sn080709_194 [Cyanophage S-RIM44]AOO13075.1 hypothetical protein W2100709_195 [Cyanophage S-RIM44]
MRRSNQGASNGINPLGYSQRKLCLTPLQTVSILGVTPI